MAARPRPSSRPSGDAPRRPPPPLGGLGTGSETPSRHGDMIRAGLWEGKRKRLVFWA